MQCLRYVGNILHYHVTGLAVNSGDAVPDTCCQCRGVTSKTKSCCRSFWFVECWVAPVSAIIGRCGSHLLWNCFSLGSSPPGYPRSTVFLPFLECLQLRVDTMCWPSNFVALVLIRRVATSRWWRSMAQRVSEARWCSTAGTQGPGRRTPSPAPSSSRSTCSKISAHTPGSGAEESRTQRSERQREHARDNRQPWQGCACWGGYPSHDEGKSCLAEATIRVL